MLRARSVPRGCSYTPPTTYAPTLSVALALVEIEEAHWSAGPVATDSAATLAHDDLMRAQTSVTMTKGARHSVTPAEPDATHSVPLLVRSLYLRRLLPKGPIGINLFDPIAHKSKLKTQVSNVFDQFITLGVIIVEIGIDILGKGVNVWILVFQVC